METQDTNLDGTLSEFAAVTGISLDEPEVLVKAQALLSRHNQNLNNAVLAFFENGLDSPDPQELVPIETIADTGNNASGAERHESFPVHRNLQHEFHYHSLLPRFPKAPRISNNWQFELGIHVSMKEQETKEEATSKDLPTPPPKKSPLWWLILLIFPKALSMLFSLVRFLLGFSAPSSVRRISNKKFNYDNYELGYNFERDLRLIDAASNYNIHTSGFNQWHEESKKEYEFMFMVLVDNESFAFVEQLLLAPEFDALFNKNTGEFKSSKLYFSNVEKDPEAFEVYKNYRLRRFPLIVLLGNVSNDPAVMSSMSIIYRSKFSFKETDAITGFNTPSLGDTVSHVKHILADYSPQLVTKRFDKQEMEFSRMLKVQQDEAYLESLQQDIIKKQEKVLKTQQEATEAHRVRNRMTFLHHIKSNGVFQSQVEHASVADTVRVAIKMPDGKRVIQKFLRTAPVNEVYLFTETQLVEIEGEIDEDLPMGIEQYCQEYQFNFELIKPMPKVVLPATLRTIEEFGALKSGDNILVEYLDNE